MDPFESGLMGFQFGRAQLEPEERIAQLSTYAAAPERKSKSAGQKNEPAFVGGSALGLLHPPWLPLEQLGNSASIVRHSPAITTIPAAAVLLKLLSHRFANRRDWSGAQLVQQCVGQAEQWRTF